MIYPSIAELTKDTGINRYTLVIAAAKSARVITDEYVRQKEYVEKQVSNKEADKNKAVATLIKKEYRDEKAVKLAVAGLYSRQFKIVYPEDADNAAEAEDAAAEDTVAEENTSSIEE